MKKLLPVIFLFSITFAYADVNIDQMSTCAMANFVASKRYETSGNSQMKNKYFSEAQYWLRAGDSKFGEGVFAQKLRVIGPIANAASDADISLVIKTCADLKNSSR